MGATKAPARRRRGGISLSAAVEDWMRALAAANKSEKTRKSYADAAISLARWLEAQGRPDPAVDKITTKDLRDWQHDQLTRLKATTARGRHVALNILFGWLLAEGEIEANPMERVDRPMVPEAEVAPRILSGDEIAALLKALRQLPRGKASTDADFRQRRDQAIAMLMLNCGLRLAEVAGLKVEDLNLRAMTAEITRKGRRPYSVPFGDKVADSLARYMRARKDHPHAELPWLWIGRHGRFTSVGIDQMIRARGEEGGIEGLHAHVLRHTWAARAKRAGVSDGDLMVLGGWKDRSMVDRYGKADAEARAAVTARSMPEVS